MAGVAGRSGGRNARTTQEHQQRGTYRGDRHGGNASPDPPKGAPTPPKTLEGDAQAEWDRMIWRLGESATLSVVDGGALYQYCRLFAETEAIATNQAHTAGLIEKLDNAVNGGEDREPLDGANLASAIQSLAKLKQLEAKYTSDIRQGRMAQRIFLVEFGLTPAARSRVKIAKPEAAQDEWDGLVN